MTEVAARLQGCQRRLTLAALATHRNATEITLLAVSKTKSADAIREAAAAGQRQFGESYVQESIDKILLLVDLGLTWHFIGPLQSNKSRPVAEHFDWVQSLDRLKIAERLSQQRPRHRGPLQVCIQVNISNEPQKAGVSVDELPAFAAAVRALPGLQLRGLMAIPEPSSDPLQQRQPFARMRALFDDLRQTDHQIDTLSMGMSDDLEAAVAEGSTMVRIGTAIFGSRV
ncbi:MAG: YggS family pyridoxal phosphate-dependent enzyme [Gammaproteobacteria bacterium]|nr:YggS family pyridoxal phosphate-dependent enzyme [Gammaproteobacteria bacterium]